MSKTYNMVIVGNGSGFLATLHVTVTNGTATSVTASKNGQSVSLTYDSTNGWWECNVHSPGTWTVTASGGTHAGQKTVEISSVAVYEAYVTLIVIPSGYTQLEYIEGTGTQYINLNISLTNNSVIYGKMYTYQQSQQSIQGLFGGRQSATQNNCSGSVNFFVQDGNVYNLDFGNYQTNRIIPTIVSNKWVSFEINYPKLIFDGVEYVLANAGSFSTPATYLFDQYNKWTGTCYIGRISKFTIQGVRDMIPARRNSDSVLGMYDTVNNVFYTNAGTGSFIAGPAV